MIPVAYGAAFAIGPPPAPSPAPPAAIIFNPPPPRISPSQMDTFAMCERKWGWQYLDGIRPPQHRSAQVGERVHKILESWLRSGVPPDPNEVLVIDGHTYHPGKIAMSGLHNLPPPGPHHDIEIDFEVPFYTGPHAMWRGRIDSAYEVLDPTVGLRGIGGGAGGVPEVLDHKTTSDLGYRKMPSDLVGDVQALVYAHAAMHRTGAQLANLRWVYYKTSPPYKSEPTFLRMDKSQVVEALSQWEELARYPLAAKAQKARAIDMKPDARACERFGGCPHKSRCNLTGREKMIAMMTAENSLLAKIKQKSDEAGMTPAAPPPPIANIAPVFTLPAPWIVHPQDATWLFNQQTGEMLPHTHETLMRLAPPPPPPVQVAPLPPLPPPAPQVQFAQAPVYAAPPQPPTQVALPVYAAPPPVPQAPPPPAPVYAAPVPPAPPPVPGSDAAIHAAMDKMGIPDRRPQASAPMLEPSEKIAIEMAIKLGATDAQILQMYPHAAQAVAAMRSGQPVLAGATGINAPEGANTPPLAQPAAPPQAAPDNFDTMDPKALRKFAQQHGIDVKGLREANLRSTVKQQWAARVNGSNGTPPVAAPPVPVQQTIWQQPPSASIPQAVAQHVAAATAAQPPAPASPHVAEIRAALDELNRVGDRLRRLIGAD